MVPMNAVAFAAVEVSDRRKESRREKNPLTLNAEAMEIALAVTGVDVTPDTKIKIRLRDAVRKGQQGQARQVAPGVFVVDVFVARKPHYEDRHHYVVNNSLLHELRHVAQAQVTPEFPKAYAAAQKKVGYERNPFEREARFYGRLADHTGTKDTGPAGSSLGREVWAVRLG